MKLLNSWIKAFEAIEKVKATSSRNAKRDILLASADNPILKRLVGITYSGQKYHITPPNTSKGLKLRKVTALAKRWAEFEAITKELCSRAISGNKAKERVETFLSSCYIEESELYQRAWKRDLSIGVAETTFNQIWPDLFKSSEFNGCMLAKEWKPPKDTQNIDLFVEAKLDGLRCITLIDQHGNPKLFTRGGKEVTHLPHIVKSINALELKGRVLDGELVVLDDCGRTDWKLTLSLAKPRKHISPEMALEIEKRVQYHVFDFLPLKSYLAGCSPSSYIKRRKRLASALRVEANEPICVTLSNRVTKVQQIDKLYQQYLDLGYEGVILKDPESTYRLTPPGTNKRFDGWYKVKPIKDVSGTVTGYEKGKGKHAALEKDTVDKIVKFLDHRKGSRRVSNLFVSVNDTTPLPLPVGYRTRLELGTL
jgi:hypothetical protein